VVVSNTAGSVTSSAATLTFNTRHASHRWAITSPTMAQRYLGSSTVAGTASDGRGRKHYSGAGRRRRPSPPPQEPLTGPSALTPASLSNAAHTINRPRHQYVWSTHRHHRCNRQRIQQRYDHQRLELRRHRQRVDQRHRSHQPMHRGSATGLRAVLPVRNLSDISRT